MYRRISAFGLACLCLAFGAQAQQVTDQAASTEAAQKQQILADKMAHLPPTHPPGQDITYNSRFAPRFPKEAAAAGHYGVVTLLILVNANGDIGEVRVQESSGYPELDASAVEAAKHWLYIPQAVNGVPQAGWVRTPVTFNRPVPPPPSTDSLRMGVATEADAKALLGQPAGEFHYNNGVTDMIWGNKSVGNAILRFDANGKLVHVSRTLPASD
jgi:TonB family protein